METKVEGSSNPLGQVDRTTLPNGNGNGNGNGKRPADADPASSDLSEEDLPLVSMNEGFLLCHATLRVRRAALRASSVGDLCMALNNLSVECVATNRVTYFAMLSAGFGAFLERFTDAPPYLAHH